MKLEILIFDYVFLRDAQLEYLLNGIYKNIQFMPWNATIVSWAGVALVGGRTGEWELVANIIRP